MATSAYPYMIFATEAAGLDKDRLVALLEEAAPGGTAEQTSIKLTWTRDGYRFTYWFEDADRVGEMYADYLPEGARRRPVVNATTVIDMSGEADPDAAHETDARAIVTHLAAQGGVHVFSESTKRFVGLPYGDEPADERDLAAAAAQVPGPAVPMPDPVATPVDQAPEKSVVEHVEPAEAPLPIPAVAETPAVVEPDAVVTEPDFLSPRETAPAPDFLEAKPVAEAPDFLEAKPVAEAPDVLEARDGAQPTVDDGPVEERVDSARAGDFGEPGVAVPAPVDPIPPVTPRPSAETAATPHVLEPADEAARLGDPTEGRAGAARVPGQAGPVVDPEPVRPTVAEPSAEPADPDAWRSAPAQPDPASGDAEGGQEAPKPEEKGFFKRLFGRR